MCWPLLKKLSTTEQGGRTIFSVHFDLDVTERTHTSFLSFIHFNTQLNLEGLINSVEQKCLCEHFS